MVRVKTRRITRKENLLRPLTHEIALSETECGQRVLCGLNRSIDTIWKISYS